MDHVKDLIHFKMMVKVLGRYPALTIWVPLVLLNGVIAELRVSEEIIKIKKLSSR